MENQINELLRNNNEILVVTNSRLVSINEETVQLLKEQKQENTSIIQHIKEEYDRLEKQDSNRNDTEETIYQYLARLLLALWDYR